MGNCGRSFNSQLHHGLINRRRFPRTSFSLLVPISPKLVELLKAVCATGLLQLPKWKFRQYQDKLRQSSSNKADLAQFGVSGPSC